MNLPDWNNFTWLWVFWAAFFVVVEGIAVFNNSRNDTLSEQVWILIGTKAEEKTVVMWAWRVSLVVLIAWLVPHFMTGWRWFNN